MLLGRPLVDFEAVATGLESFMSAVDDCAVPLVIFASTTPCFDPASLYYRVKAQSLIKSVLSGHRCTYLDLLPLASAATETWLGREAFFADGIHLGIAGQAAVGRRIAEQIKAHIFHASTTAVL